MRRRGRDLHVAGGVEPGVNLLLLAELADAPHRCLCRLADRQRRLIAPAAAQRGEREPHRVAKTTVAAARAAAADLLGLEQDDAGTGLELAQVPGRPEPGVAAADDEDVGLALALQARRRLDRTGLLDPVAVGIVAHRGDCPARRRSALSKDRPRRCPSQAEPSA